MRVNIRKFMLLARIQDGPLKQKVDEEANPGCLFERYDRTSPLAMFGCDGMREDRKMPLKCAEMYEKKDE